jgi:hypothetical protein
MLAVGKKTPELLPPPVLVVMPVLVVTGRRLGGGGVESHRRGRQHCSHGHKPVNIKKCHPEKAKDYYNQHCLFSPVVFCLAHRCFPSSGIVFLGDIIMVKNHYEA